MTEWIYPDEHDLLELAEIVLGQPPIVREPGLLSSSAYRPATSFGGVEVYTDVWTKAAALMHSLCMNHVLLDGNKRLAWSAGLVFLELNGEQFGRIDTDSAVEFVLSIAKGELSEVEQIAAGLHQILRKA